MAEEKCYHYGPVSREEIARECGPYYPARDYQLGIYADSHCFQTPEDFRRLRQLGFSLVAMTPEQWRSAARASGVWTLDRVLLDIQDLCYYLHMEGADSLNYNQLLLAIEAIIAEARRNGVELYGLHLDEPTTRDHCSVVWDALYATLQDRFQVGRPGGQRLYADMFANADAVFNRVDGIILDNFVDDDPSIYWEEIVSDARRHQSPGRPIHVSAWINMSEPAHRTNLAYLFDNATRIFGRVHAPELWLYTADICEEILRYLEQHVVIPIPGGTGLMHPVWSRANRSDGHTWDIVQIRRELETAQIISNVPDTSRRRGSDSTRSGRSGAGGASQDASPEFDFLLENMDVLSRFLLSCVDGNGGLTGSVCGCGMARDIECGIQCERMQEFLRAALQAGWLRQDCSLVERTIEQVWWCPGCRCRWDPSNSREMSGWQLAGTNTNIVRTPLPPGSVRSPAVDICPAFRPSRRRERERRGMVVFRDPGFIFGRIEESDLPAIVKPDTQVRTRE